MHKKIDPEDGLYTGVLLYNNYWKFIHNIQLRFGFQLNKT